MTDAPSGSHSYAPIAVSAESTVVAEFEPDAAASDGHQSEAQLEASLIEQLVKQGYGRLSITNSADLVANLRRQLEVLNDLTFSDGEWQRFFTTSIASAADGIAENGADPVRPHPGAQA